MKKTAIVTATLLAASGAWAQSNVSLYGRLDLGAAQVKTTDYIYTTGTNPTSTSTSTTQRSLFGAQNKRSTSRLGVKGEESLGAGTKAGFVYELEINPDNSTALGSAATALGIGKTRAANAYITSSIGTGTIGTFDNAFDDVRGYSATATIPGGDPLYNFEGSYFIGSKSQNAARYTSPEFAGMVLSLTSALEETKTKSTTGLTTTTARDNKAILGLGYNRGPFSTNVALGQSRDNTTEKWQDLALAASYDLGMAVPYIVAERGKVKDSTSTSVNATGVELGSRFPMGAFTPFVSVHNVKEKVSGDKTQGWQVGTNYDLSKRTYTYLAAGSAKQKADGNTTQKGTGVALGLVHQF